ncbi:hypothetical protein EMIHUDRAFT_435932 [Emiliania huxleyi CCMP1516]|uniref:Uncharacterized protein n=2 Tax=Emiliania huxleyi TaxID=2903 RepID=A0A0D3J8X4_EMIH1|nr:hypothetical protein EMIHUDRAFT_435932 [Emiliania huxleyi CCMP1516]EOD19959.1 hypothetical protein EMIHUDRAFT_435932 [Emiliania huxleyi CCMP1516]|eukprot:XP_005772388.1 hypothetical protein EMIHUDRAFT_435932 [Emiliania huxleyi CCMP1516]
MLEQAAPRRAAPLGLQLRRTSMSGLPLSVLRSTDALDHASPASVVCFLVYLHAETFSPGDRATSLTRELQAALHDGVPLLLVHERRRAHGAATFNEIAEATPPALKASGVYRRIATPVFDEPHAAVSARLLLDQLEQLASRSSTGSLLRRLSGHLGSSLMSSLGNSIASSDGSKSGGDDAHPPPHGGAATSPARRRKLPPRTEPAQRQSCPAGPARAAPRRQSCPDSGGRQDVEVV